MKLFKRKWFINTPEVVYELKVGGTYLIEYSAQAVSRGRIAEINLALYGKGIDVVFVANSTNHRAFEPVPATPVK